MKKQFFKVLSVLLSIMMIFSVCSVVAYADTTAATPSYYVKAGGTGDGRSAATPAKSVASAVASMNADGYKAGDTVNIYLMQDYSSLGGYATMNGLNHNLPGWKDYANGETMPKHTAKIVVQGYEDYDITYLAETTTANDIHPMLDIQGPTVFKNVSATDVRWNYNDPFLVVGPNEFTWIHDDPYAAAYMLWHDGQIERDWAPPMSTSAGGTVDGEVTLNIEGGIVFGSMYIGCSNPNQGAVTYKDDVNVIFNHPDIGCHESMSYSSVLAPADVTFEKNLNVIVKDVADISFSKGDGTATVLGAVNYVIAPGETIGDHLDALANFAEGTKIYTLNPATKDIIDKISFTDVAGVYNVTEGLKATNADGDVVVYDKETMTLTLPSTGKWTIETCRDPITKDYYVENGGTGDGRTPETAAASVIDVVKTINADGLVSGDTANVYLIEGELLFPGNNTHTMPVWGVTGGKPEAHTALLNIMPYSGNTGTTHLAHSAECGAINQVMYLAGPTKIDGVQIVSNRWSYNHEIYACGNDFTLGENLSFGQVGSGATSVEWDYGMHVMINDWGDISPYNKPVNVVYKYGSIGVHRFGFGNAYDRSAEVTFNEDVNITLDNKGLGSHSNFNFTVVLATPNSTINFEKNLNLKVLNATDINFGGDGVANVKGAVQHITDTDTIYITELCNTSTFAAGTKFYKLVADNTILNYIDFTKTAGEYKISDGKEAKATNANGDVVLSENGILILTEGTWNITEYDPNATFSVTVTDGTADKAAAKFGETVTITAAEKAGYNFAGWEVVAGGVKLADAAAATTTFVMADAAVEVKATYVAIEYAIAVTDGTADKEVAAAGTTITITADAAPEGYIFAGWEVVAGAVEFADAAAETTTFVMPGEAVEVKATYVEEPIEVIDVITYLDASYDLVENTLTIEYDDPSAEFKAALTAAKAADGRVVELVVDVDGKEYTFPVSIYTYGGKFTVKGFSMAQMNADIKVFVRIANDNIDYAVETNALEINIAETVEDEAWLAFNEAWKAADETIDAADKANIGDGLVDISAVKFNFKDSAVAISYDAPSDELKEAVAAAGANRTTQMIVVIEDKEYAFDVALYSEGGTLTVKGFALPHYYSYIQFFVRVTNDEGYLAEFNIVSLSIHELLLADASDIAAAYRVYVGAEAAVLTESATINKNIYIYGTTATDAVTVSGEGVVVNIQGGYYDAADKDTAVWANGGATVNIYDGMFMCDGLGEPATSANHQDMIYAGSGSAGAGTINIYGGWFEARSEGAWLLNERDDNGTITVYGGTFVNWNPADNMSEGAGTNFVADGYKVIEEVQEDGDVWYIVVAE